MEGQDEQSFQRKSGTPQSTPEALNYDSIIGMLTPESSKCFELLANTEEFNEKRKPSISNRKSRTISGDSRGKAKSGENEKSPSIPTSKSFSVQSRSNSFDRRSIGSASSTFSSHSKVKEPGLGRNKPRSSSKNNHRYQIDYEDFESTSMFSQAVYEQWQMIELLRLGREELVEKMVEKIRSKAAIGADFTRHFFQETPNAINFQNSYTATLEEIFQAWVNLFYFIINLKINLIRMLNIAGTEPFRPNSEMEKEILGQAIECVKFLSKLKMKSMVNSTQALSDYHNLDEVKFKEYEERISSPFLSDMNYIQKKAREVLKAKKEQQTPFS